MHRHIAWIPLFLSLTLGCFSSAAYADEDDDYGEGSSLCHDEGCEDYCYSDCGCISDSYVPDSRRHWWNWSDYSENEFDFCSECWCPGDPCWYRKGIFMPDCPPLFPELMADPRAVCLSAGWRFGDAVFDHNTIDVSYGQPFPIWRWSNVFFSGDCMEIDLQGALWAIFEPLRESAPLVNADYYVGFPLTWGYGRWSWRLRGYHVSSHIGDEFLLNHPGFQRHNPSAQYLDFFLAFQITPAIRLYGGYGRIFMMDDSFPVKRNYFEYGAETYLPWCHWYNKDYCVLGQPFFAMHFRNLQDDDYREDSTFVLGYEFRNLTGMEGKLRAFMEYHKGQCLEGQFARFRTDYFSLRISYGY